MSKISFLHGPPGTGKTYSATFIANWLFQKEEGRILICAPSNFATDNLVTGLASIGQLISLQRPKVLRIFAHSKENYPLQSIGNTFAQKMHLQKLIFLFD
jgi:regulator of nonsense transcripts 1